ncbi:MAG: putative outer membrane protein ompA family [Nitrospira sp.]|jgi:OOP family OmpA-OmpF porin|nr:putative outer membrane protein ompA family [Nitrospira sp.]
MSRRIILGVGLLALTLLAFLCIPRHLPVTPSTAVRPAFHAGIENGQLTISGHVASEDTKRAALSRAQELAKGTRLHVTDNLKVMPDSPAAGWEAALPALLTQFSALQHHQASLSFSDHAVTVKGAVANGEAKIKLLHEFSSLVGTSITVHDQVTVTAAIPATLPPTSAVQHASRAQVQAGLDETLRGEPIPFESNSAVLTSKGRAVIEKLVPVLKRSPEAVIEIGGHTDSYGDPEYNLQLSRRRAESVRQYLVERSVTNRLAAVGYGSAHPLSHERTRAAAKKNRRIEFRVKEER